MHSILDFILHLDSQLPLLTEQLGGWIYALLFLVIFLETGLVFTPFLPGDSLIFIAATLAGHGSLHFGLLWLTLWAASALGDSVNYSIGKRFGLRLERSQKIRADYIQKTKDFYHKHGKKTIVLARFVPIVRTFAPFIAGIGKMPYHEFLVYNLAGGFLWVSALSLAGLFFGQLPWVQANLEWVVLIIVGLSLLPPLVEALKRKKP